MSQGFACGHTDRDLGELVVSYVFPSVFLPVELIVCIGYSCEMFLLLDKFFSHHQILNSHSGLEVNLLLRPI